MGLAIYSTYVLASSIDNDKLLIPIALLVLYGGYIFSVIYKKYETRELVSANWGTITLQALFCIGVCITLLF